MASRVQAGLVYKVSNYNASGPLDVDKLRVERIVGRSFCQ
jgi:hypothetical protein